MLQAFHDNTRRFFVESVGEGAGRQLPFTEELLLLDNDPTGQQQPGPPASFPMSSSEPAKRIAADEFHVYHDVGLEFLHPIGFGLVRDRANVFGFRSHGYRYLGEPVHESKPWRVRHVSLVGILNQPQPVVYLTDGLPSMEQIRQEKTRPLDAFEEPAMASLREGEDLVVIRDGNVVRMVGSLRATETCLKCHEANVGDLLGALSYTLRLR